MPQGAGCTAYLLSRLISVGIRRYGAFSRILERFQEKWTRFSVRKRDQTGNLEHFHESINLGNALNQALCITALSN